jgi:MFS family permease
MHFANSADLDIKKMDENRLTQTEKGFYWLLFGQVISLVGSGMTCFANSIWVYTDLGSSILNLSILAFLAFLPGVIISPIAGVLVDKWNRKLVIIIGDTVAALATLSLRMIIKNGSFQIWQLYIIVIIISIANHFQWPAFFSTVKLMVPSRRFGAVNGMVEGARSIGQVAAPLMAGFAVAAFSITGVILFDLGSYLIALTIILFIKFSKIDAREATPLNKNSFFKELIKGWKYLLVRPNFIRILILFGVANFLFVITNNLIIPLGLELGSSELLGIITSVSGITMIAGSVIMSVWGGPKNRVNGVMLFMFFQIIALCFLGFRPSLLSLFIGFALFSFAIPIINACSGTIWHSKIPLNLQGRVLAASGMVYTLSLQLGYLSSGFFADYVFIPWLSQSGALVDSNIARVFGTGKANAIGFLAVCLGVLGLIILGIMYRSKSLRKFELSNEEIKTENNGKGYVYQGTNCIRTVNVNYESEER